MFIVRIAQKGIGVMTLSQDAIMYALQFPKHVSTKFSAIKNVTGLGWLGDYWYHLVERDISGQIRWV
jgi:hypothetical protein